MIIFYFTATGNSLYVAKRLGGELCSIPRMMKEGKREFSDDAIGVVFPCFAFGLPRIVVEFLQQSIFTADYIFAVMTYGNMAASGLQHLEKVGGQVGISFDYTNEIRMIDNYLPMFNMEEQLEKEGETHIDETLKKIVNDVTSREHRLTRKGMGSVVFSKLIHAFFSKGLPYMDKQFRVNEQCNRCKICEKVCPRGNIRVGHTPEYLHHCEGCYACIHHCPQNAIHIKSERSNARFRNAQVTLQEIIAANNQGR